ncbi:MAG: branched-chain amino acid transaminase [Candidatus Bipolaricaulaceae bacterium]
MTSKYAFFQGQIRPLSEAKISVMTSAFNYGTGVFEGIRAFWNPDEEQLYLFRLREHYVRFLANCRLLLIDLPYSVDQLAESTVELLLREGYREDVYVRPLAYKSTEMIGVKLHGLDADCTIFALPFGAYIDRPGGIRAMVSSWRRVDDTAIPARGKITGSYVNSALAKTEAALAGFDEALLLSQDGHLSEGSAENVFLVRNGELITPPVTANVLEGITRATVLQLARELDIPIQERPVDRTELYVAEEVFLAGTGAGMVPVVEVDHRPVGRGVPGPLFSRLQGLYERMVRGREPARRGWCTPVYPA